MLRITLILLPTVLFFGRPSHAQRKAIQEFYLVYDKDWNRCDPDSGTYLSFVQQFDDTTWQWNHYNYWGPLLLVETYRDRDAQKPHGYFAYFNKTGRIDSAGQVSNGYRDGEWYLYEDSLKPQVVKNYVKGRLTEVRRVEKKEGGVPDGKEAQFRKGMKNWVRYLQQNIQFPPRAEGKNIKGTAAIGFVVNTSGEIESTRILQSVEFSIDREALRLVSSSPPWEPAFQEGKNVKAYRIQPITFSY